MALLNSGLGNVFDVDPNAKITALEARVRAQENKSTLNVPVPITISAATARIASINDDNLGGNEINVASLRTSNGATSVVAVSSVSGTANQGAYIANYESDSIDIITADVGVENYSITGGVTSIVFDSSADVTVGPLKIKKTPDESKIVVFCSVDNSLRIIDNSGFPQTSASVLIGNLDEDYSDFALTNTEAYVVSNQNTIKVVLLATPAVTHTLSPVSPFTSLPAEGIFSSAVTSSYVFFSDLGAEEIYRIDTTSKVIEYIDTATLGGIIELSPDEDFLLYGSIQHDNIYEYDMSVLTGANPSVAYSTRVTRAVDSFVVDMKISNDGSKIYAAAINDDVIKVITRSTASATSFNGVEIPVLNQPDRPMYINNSGTRIYIKGRSGDPRKLDVIDTLRDVRIDPVYTSGNPTDVAINDTDDKIYVAITERDAVDVFEFNSSVNMNNRADMATSANFGEIAVVRASNASVTLGSTYDASYGVSEPATYNAISEKYWSECWHGHAWFIPHSNLISRIETNIVGAEVGAKCWLRVRIYSDPGEFVTYTQEDGTKTGAAIPQVAATFYVPAVHTDANGVADGALVEMPAMDQFLQTVKQGHTGVNWLTWIHGVPQYAQRFGSGLSQELLDVPPSEFTDNSFGDVYQQTYSISIDAALSGTKGYVEVLKPSVWWCTPAGAMLGWKYQTEDAFESANANADAEGNFYNPIPTPQNPQQLGVFSS